MNIKLNDFLNKLDEKSIHYQLRKVRDEAIMVDITVPGEKWEVEFMDDDTIEIERFLSDGNIYDESELEHLFENFSD